MTERFVREWRVEGDRILAALASALELDGELLEPPERAAVGERAEGLRRAMEGDDFLAIKAWIESLDAASKPFAERRMDKHVRRAMAGHRVEEFAQGPRTTGAIDAGE